MADTPTRLMVAYLLILFMALAAAGMTWWKVRQSPRRVEARKRARRRAAHRANDPF
jgi:uncharacterized iron-regulated membrane protein